MRILIIEDDERIGKNVKEMLGRDHYAVDLTATGKEGLEKAESEDYDLLIVDWTLPDMDGPTIVKTIRSLHSSVPVLFLTAKSQPEDVVIGLDSGADDYISKPFQMQVLLARVRSLLRRRDSLVSHALITIADLTIDTNLHQVQRNGKQIDLAPKEYALLEYLALHKNHSINRMDLLTHVWDENADPFSNTVDVHIRYLRSKIDEPFSPKLIRTIKGSGYAVCDHDL